MTIANARRLRRELTDAERKLWYELRGRRFIGFKFRRQVLLAPYVVDFCCYEARLIIEIDGAHHGDDQAQRRHDDIRTHRLSEYGYRVLRFWNNEVLDSKFRSGTLVSIASALGIED